MCIQCSGGSTDMSGGKLLTHDDKTKKLLDWILMGIKSARVLRIEIGRK